MINIKQHQHRQKQENCNDVKPVCMVTIPCIKGLSKKFKRIGYRFNIKIFKTGNTIGSILRKLNAKKDLLVKP